LLKNDFLKNSILDARSLMVFNKYAVIIAALIAGYLILDTIFVRPSRKAAMLIAKVSVARNPLTVPAEKIMPIETKGYSYYSNRISGRNIFGAGSSVQGESQVSDTESSQELAGGGLGLVGIIPGANPQAIVEDKKNQKTYYLIKGQSINGIMLEDIDKDKVMLDYKGKKMTLFL
jgi:type II secretory pathway component PulC